MDRQRLRIQRAKQTSEIQKSTNLTAVAGLMPLRAEVRPAETASASSAAPAHGPVGGHRFGDYALLPPGEYPVSQPGDASEAAADRLAQRALASTPTEPPLTAAGTAADRLTAPGSALNRQAVSPSASQASAGGAMLPGGGGAPLSDAMRQTFEPRFGHDFSQVRIYADSRAAAAAAAMDARAFTLGRDIVFGAGQYAPESAPGQRLLAHELAHVVQAGTAVPPGTVLRAGGGVGADPISHLVRPTTFAMETPEGGKLATFKEVSGLEFETEVHEQTQATKDGKTVIIKSQGAQIQKPGKITAKYAASQDDPILKWRQEVIDGNMSKARRNASIIVYDVEDKETFRFNLFNAWPSKFSWSTLSAKSTEGMQITVTFEHEGMSMGTG